MSSSLKDALNQFVIETLKENKVLLYAQVHQEGRKVAEYQRLGGKTRFNVWSLAKGVVSCAAGIALDEGLIRLDERIGDIFPECMPSDPGPFLPRITIEHLLTMTSGLAKPLFFADHPERYRTEDWIGYFFHAAFAHEPGSAWLYSNFNTYMVSCAIERRAGQNLVEYLRHRFFAPIGILSPDWTLDPKGHCHAANGLNLTIDEMARYGELIKNFGRFEGRQVVPEAYMRRATSHLVDNNGPVPWENAGYGYQFLLNPEKGSFRSEGRLGQFCLVFPEQDAVVCTLAVEADFHRLGRLLWQHVVPAIAGKSVKG